MTVRDQTTDLPPQTRGHRWHAATYDALLRPTERRLLARVRPRLLGELSGDVLEVGAGTGANFAYYPAGVNVIATEPDPFMRERAQRRVLESGRSDIEVRDARAERLPFDDASFDHVVATLIFCTVPDAVRGLGEIRRVLRSGGTFRFIEHVRNDESRFWGGFQDRVAPVWRWFGAGCNPNRRTEQAIRQAGFRFDWIEHDTAGPGTPAIFGMARPGEREGDAG